MKISDAKLIFSLVVDLLLAGAGFYILLKLWHSLNGLVI